MGARRGSAILFAVAAMLAACSPPPPPKSAAPVAGRIEFEGTWTASGTRQVVPMGPARRASIASFDGSLVLTRSSGDSRGFRAQALVLNDSATGMAGRAVWTDEHGDQAYSELRGEGTAAGNRVTGTFVGGTGRYAGLTGEYQFGWRFVLEDEDGRVQGQSVGLKGEARLAAR